MAVSDRLDAGRLGSQRYLGASNRQHGPAASTLEPMSNAKFSRMSTASSAFAVDSAAFSKRSGQVIEDKQH